MARIVAAATAVGIITVDVAGRRAASAALGSFLGSLRLLLHGLLDLLLLLFELFFRGFPRLLLLLLLLLQTSFMPPDDIERVQLLVVGKALVGNTLVATLGVTPLGA